jgi:hypothetical protein
VNDDERLARGHRALELLKSDVITEAFASLENEYVEAMLGLDRKNDLERYRLMEAVKVVRGVRQHLHEIVETGKIASRRAEELAGKRRFL